MTWDASGIAVASRSEWKPQMVPLFTECVEAVFNTHPDVAANRHSSASEATGTIGRPVSLSLSQMLYTSMRTRKRSAREELYRIGQRYSHTRSISILR